MTVNNGTYNLLAFSGVSNSFHRSGLVSFAESVSLNKQKPSAVSYKTNILLYSEEGIRPHGERESDRLRHQQNRATRVKPREKIAAGKRLQGTATRR